MYLETILSPGTSAHTIGGHEEQRTSSIIDCLLTGVIDFSTVPSALRIVPVRAWFSSLRPQRPSASETHTSLAGDPGPPKSRLPVTRFLQPCATIPLDLRELKGQLARGPARWSARDLDASRPYDLDRCSCRRSEIHGCKIGAERLESGRSEVQEWAIWSSRAARMG